MLTITDRQAIYIYTQAVDMRKSVNGLCILLQELFEKNPQSGDVYLFTNKCRNKVKCLIWDTNGFVLYYKRLERGRFSYSKYISDNEIMITHAQLKGLLMGLDFYLIGMHASGGYGEYF